MTDSTRAQHIPTHTPTPKEFLEVSQSPEFASLKTTFRSFAFPMTLHSWPGISATSLPPPTPRVLFSVPSSVSSPSAWYWDSRQFVTAGLITWAYVRFADNKLDPAAEAIRTMMENPKDA